MMGTRALPSILGTLFPLLVGVSQALAGPSVAPLDGSTRSAATEHSRNSERVSGSYGFGVGLTLVRTSSATCVASGQWTQCAADILQDSLHLERKLRTALVTLGGMVRTSSITLATCLADLEASSVPVVLPGEPEALEWYYWLGERVLWLVAGGGLVGLGILLL